MSEQPILFEEESHSARLSRKSKEAPFFPLGKHFILSSFTWYIYIFK